ncbi:MAG: MBL fold metallo-hydrolase [Patescibacteria group bacterium]|jgi:L-ascorbate metabolism protein UlaG (beta-lactamase superfamily)
MQIKYRGSAKFEIKFGTTLIELDDKVVIDSFVLPGPGEYERSGVSVTGIGIDDGSIYVLKAEDMTLLYLGRLKRPLSQEEIKEAGGADILFLPLGEEGTISTKNSLALVAKFDPRVVIPMMYSDLSEFKKTEGISDGEVDILRIRRADLAEEEQKIVILQAK